MAKSDKKKKRTTSKSQVKKSRIETIQENKALFSVLFLIALIILSAVSIGIYYAAQAFIENDEDVALEAENDDESDEVAQDDSSQEENEEQQEASDTENNQQVESSEEVENNEEPSEDNQENSTDTDEDTQDQQEENENSNEPSIDGNGISTENEEAVEEALEDVASAPAEKGSEQVADQNNESTQAGEVLGTSTVWEANNYEKGDITQSSYTVQSGDTLWEIADGYYGDGSMWTQILSANSSTIGFLDSGEQALIFPGQVLVLP